MLELDVVAICCLSLLVGGFVGVNIVRHADKHPSILSRLTRLTPAMIAWASLSAGTRRDGHGGSIGADANIRTLRIMRVLYFYILIYFTYYIQ